MDLAAIGQESQKWMRRKNIVPMHEAPEALPEAEAVLLSREIAEAIRQRVQHPGEVNVIRESRAVGYAR